MTLEVLAIILSILAIVPYILEIYFYITRRPVFDVVVYFHTDSKKGKNFKVDLKPSIRVNRSFLVETMVITKAENEGGHRLSMSGSSTFQELDWGKYPDGYISCPSRFQPTSIVISPFFLSAKTRRPFDFNIFYKQKPEKLKFNIFVEGKVDREGILNVFYHARNYRRQKNFSINLEKEGKFLTFKM